MRFASVALIPLAVGQAGFGCNGDVGADALGGGAMSLSLITTFFCTFLMSKLQQHKHLVSWTVQYKPIVISKFG